MPWCIYWTVWGYHQSDQVNNFSCPTAGVSGPSGGLDHITPESAGRKTSPRKSGSGADAAETASNSLTPSPDNRETACNITGSSPSLSVLPIPTGESTEGTEQQQSILQCSFDPLPSSLGRTNLVAGEACSMERQGAGPPTGDRNDSVRCIPTGLGSCVQWHQERGTLVSGGTEIAHKLPGATSCNPGSAILPKGSSRNICTSAARQSDSCSIHQQPRGTVSPQLMRTCGCGHYQGHCPGC